MISVLARRWEEEDIFEPNVNEEAAGTRSWDR